MTIERVIRIMAGFFVMLSLLLGVEGSPLFVSRWFLAFTSTMVPRINASAAMMPSAAAAPLDPETLNTAAPAPSAG